MPTIHFRDCKQWADENLKMSTTNDEVVKIYDHALHQMISHTPDESVGGIMGALDKMLKIEPNFVMGRVFDTAMKCMGSNARLDSTTKEAAESLDKLKNEKVNINEREKLHCSAIVHWANENTGKACDIWDEILFTYPRDTLALSFTYLNHLYKGDSAMLRDCVARVLNHWDESDPYYGYILNKYAFGLEETNMFDKAEETVKKGLSFIPTDSWGVHTYSHIFESMCRSSEGAEFLRRTEPDWSGNSLACHVYWHLSLYYIEQQQYEEALSLYDDLISPMFKKSGITFNINDGTQLLQRLEFEGVNVGERWKDLYAAYKTHSRKHTLCYDDAHMFISFAKSKASGETDRADQFVASLEDYLQNGSGDNRMVTKEVGTNLFSGIQAYEEKRYDDVISLLVPIKNQLVRIGGSHAQRDLFDLLLLNACIRSKSRKGQEWGRGLMNERKLLKPESPMTNRMIEKMMASHI